jgi:acyl carrier protein
MPADTTDRIIALIASTLHIDPAKITPQSSFQDLGIDSLDGINLAFALENEFGVEIPDSALPELKSVGDITTGIEKLLAAKTAAAE